ncbi:hypothetical protein GQ457_08G004840 [Hibiscus cannabinus]
MDATNKFNIYTKQIPSWLVDWIPKEGGYLIGNLQPAHMDFRFFTLENLWSIVLSLGTSKQNEAILNLIENKWDNIVGHMPLNICYPAVENEESKNTEVRFATTVFLLVDVEYCAKHNPHKETWISLTASMGKRSPHYEQTDVVPKKCAGGNASSFVGLRYETKIRCYVQVDFCGHAGYIKTMTTGDVQIDGVVLVVSCTEESRTKPREQILLAKLMGISQIVVFFNHKELVDDDEILRVVESEVVIYFVVTVLVVTECL